MLCCVIVINVISPAVESGFSSAPLAPGKAIAVQDAERAQGF